MPNFKEIRSNFIITLAFTSEPPYYIFFFAFLAFCRQTLARQQESPTSNLIPATTLLTIQKASIFHHLIRVQLCLLFAIVWFPSSMLVLETNTGNGLKLCC